MPRIDDCKVVALPQVLRDEQGNLTALEGCSDQLGFDPARVFFAYDIPGGVSRGGHAHYACEQLIVCVMGAFRVGIDDGSYQRTVTLDRAYYGLYVPPLVWTDLRDFSAGAVCLVIASRPYEEQDYIRDYDEWLSVVEPRLERAA
jgi:dTDP-4-dehydrorhamnose 3,5-epimerase-like enzyme